MSARTKNKALVYVRRSKSKQETGIRTQLGWAIDAAKAQGLQLDATPEDLEYMLVRGLRQYKAIFIDDGISGSDLNRPGFAAFRETALREKAVSHLLIHLSDRFARPELAIQAMQMEIDLLRGGITVVFSNRISLPRKRGEHHFAEDVQLLHEYTQNGEFLTKLATRVLQTQVRLAEGGYWTGGPAPYGFVRVLVDSSGNEVMELEEGMTVSQNGCHVRIKPKDMEKIRVWLQILDLHGNHGWGHKRIANHLNLLDIPSPHAGRVYERNGISTGVSGRWWPETVKRMIQNKAIIGMCAYGKTSVGVHRRFSPDGPRNLNDDNDRREDGEAKFTLNPDNQVIVSPTGYNPAADLELFDKCRQLTEERGRSQRGIPRGVNLLTLA